MKIDKELIFLTSLCSDMDYLMSSKLHPSVFLTRDFIYR